MTIDVIAPSVAAFLVGIVAGGWAGAYLMRLWDDTNKSWQNKFVLGMGVISGLGGIPSGVVWAIIKDKVVWFVISYMIALLIPVLYTYISSIKSRRRWIAPNPEHYER